MMDIETLHQALHGIASQALLEGVLHGKDGKPVDNEAIQARVDETLALILSDLIGTQLIEMENGHEPATQ